MISEKKIRNVYAFNTNGDFLWRIGECRYDFEPNDNSPKGSMYHNIELGEDGKIEAYSFGDFKVSVNMSSGEVTGMMVIR